MRTKEDYQQYLKSEHWKTLRAKAFSKWGNKCMLGPSHSSRVELHHMNYRNWYDCTENDLIPLCSVCHDKVHASKDALNALKLVFETIRNPAKRRLRKSKTKMRKIVRLVEVTEYSYKFLEGLEKSVFEALYDKYVKGRL